MPQCTEDLVYGPANPGRFAGTTEIVLELSVVVHFAGARALTVGRWKPIDGRWRYDLLTSQHGCLAVVTGLSATEFTVVPSGMAELQA